MKKDRRQINEVWEMTNRLGERYKMARVGSGKNSYIKTLEYLGTVKHGEQRNRREETSHGAPVTLVDDEGAEVYNGPMSSVTRTVVERFCMTCGDWVTCGAERSPAGILGHAFCPNCSRDWSEPKVKHLPKCGAARCSGCVNCGRGLSNR